MTTWWATRSRRRRASGEIGAARFSCVSSGIPWAELPQKERMMPEDTYQMGKDVAALHAEIVELKATVRKARDEADVAIERAEEHIWKTLKRLGVCLYDEEVDDYVVGDAFKKAEK